MYVFPFFFLFSRFSLKWVELLNLGLGLLIWIGFSGKGYPFKNCLIHSSIDLLICCRFIVETCITLFVLFFLHPQWRNCKNFKLKAYRKILFFLVNTIVQLHFLVKFTVVRFSGLMFLFLSFERVTLKIWKYSYLRIHFNISEIYVWNIVTLAYFNVVLFFPVR